jgi:hypothetical protein
MENFRHIDPWVAPETDMGSSRPFRIEQCVSQAPHRERQDPYDIQSWEVEFLRTREFLRGQPFGISAKAKTVRFPIRMLRYWFGYHLLAAEYRRTGRPLDIVEVGTHNGQMRVFARLAAHRVRDRARVLHWSRWLGVDAEPKRKILKLAGYEDVLPANIEAPYINLFDSFDTAICLHIF